MVLQEDAQSQERRHLEMRRSAKMEKAAKSMTEVSLEVDKLAGQVGKREQWSGYLATALLHYRKHLILRYGYVQFAGLCFRISDI